MIARANKTLDPLDYGITSEKMWLFCLNMFGAGSINRDNGTEAIRQAGYKGNDNTLAVRASQLIRNHKVQLAKRAIQAEVAAKLDHNRDTALNMLVGDYSYLDAKAKAGDIQAINARTAILRELDDISGLKQQQDNRQAVSITITAPEQPQALIKAPDVTVAAIAGETAPIVGDEHEQA